MILHPDPSGSTLPSAAAHLQAKVKGRVISPSDAVYDQTRQIWNAMIVRCTDALDAAQDAAGIAWSRDFFHATTPYASAGAYVNFMTADEGDRVTSAYGVNYARLKQIKRAVDPENRFHNFQAITV